MWGWVNDKGIFNVGFPAFIYQDSAQWASPFSLRMFWAQFWMFWSPVASQLNICKSCLRLKLDTSHHNNLGHLSIDQSNGTRLTTLSQGSETQSRSWNKPKEWIQHSGKYRDYYYSQWSLSRYKWSAHFPFESLQPIFELVLGLLHYC